ncbi:hypothetical protein B0T22DRAFT_472736 [Podospora appendiculata]|uniref:Uncharacterized protein n=1 Tax=Podospora appendiculata TaxID=314037 RepID=A0AAE1C7P6_9PEZI|nr:hypothetical protein B0T22DRAFT_472736 [Podospora appendiculata]
MEDRASTRLHANTAEFEITALAEQPKAAAAMGERRIHWRIPALMFAALVAGIGCAVGHHFFYSYWDGRTVPDESTQRWINRLGTAFAFLVKTALSLASGYAYIQCFWLVVRKKPFRLEGLDSLTSVLHDLSAMLQVGLWISVPGLAFIAIGTWLLPLVAVITPGTLTVSTQIVTSSMATTPPQLDLDGTRYAVTVGTVTNVPVFDIQGPTSELMRTAISSASQQAIMYIEPPAVNATYTLTFFGPSLQCNIPAEEELAEFNRQLNKTVDPGVTGNGGPDGYLGKNHRMDYHLSYNAWCPPSESEWAPTNRTFGHPTWFTNDTSPPQLIDEGNPEGQGRIYVFISPYQPSSNSSYYYDSPQVLIECQMRNASYAVTIRNAGRAQKVAIDSVEHLNAVRTEVLGLPRSQGASVSSANTTYTAIMWAFGALLNGNAVTTVAANQQPAYTSTLVQTTALRPFIEQPAAADFSNATIKTILEGLFHNITLSLLSSAAFQRNASTAEPIATQIQLAKVVFVYRTSDLLLPYGLSILFALAVCVAGAVALDRNGAAYNHDFSTLLRTTRKPDLDDLVGPAETTGCTPLDRQLGRRRVIFDTGVESGVAGFTSILSRSRSEAESEGRLAVLLASKHSLDKDLPKLPGTAGEPAAGSGTEMSSAVSGSSSDRGEFVGPAATPFQVPVRPPRR